MGSGGSNFHTNGRRSVCHHSPTWWKDRLLALWPLIKTLIPFTRAPSSGPSYLPKVPPSDTLTLGLSFSHMNLGGGKHSDHNQTSTYPVSGLFRYPVPSPHVNEVLQEQTADPALLHSLPGCTCARLSICWNSRHSLTPSFLHATYLREARNVLGAGDTKLEKTHSPSSVNPNGTGSCGLWCRKGVQGDGHTNSMQYIFRK